MLRLTLTPNPKVNRKLVETINSAEEKKRHAIAKVTQKMKQDQEIALDVLSVSIELRAKKEERLIRSLDYLNDTLLR